MSLKILNKGNIMTSKTMICAVTVFSLVFAGFAEEQVAEELGKDTNSPVNASKSRKKAEVKEINTEEKAKAARLAKELTAKKDNDKAVAKEMDKDAATAKKDENSAKAKAEKELEDSKTEEGGGSSWFSWMWPFGSSNDEKAKSEDKPADAKKVEEKKPLDVDIVEVKNIEKVEIAEPIPAVKEPEVVKPEAAKVDGVEPANNADESGVGRVLLMYFPNVYIDLSDIFSLGLSLGARAGAEVRVTRWFQIGGNYGDSYFVEKGFDRQIGGGYDDGYNFQLVALAGEERYLDDTFGSVREYIIKESKARVLSPSNEPYEDKTRDFWAIGVEAGWLVNVKALVHPVEIADFVLGLFFIDILDDNVK
jgi:hypothetical protein